ncbi:hypothetical protein [Corynebacterium striatum]|uniref:hypothetical protein n=1 Tax=Corynebacterium striatum TaxID=43770 RepID=UPI00254CB8EF|nr:hypothetical protein [Corynebacterium striatum]MDK8831617.1 hypothetical protein [Corynebacterium striatum]
MTRPFGKPEIITPQRRRELMDAAARKFYRPPGDPGPDYSRLYSPIVEQLRDDERTQTRVLSHADDEYTRRRTNQREHAAKQELRTIINEHRKDNQ